MSKYVKTNGAAMDRHIARIERERDEALQRLDKIIRERTFLNKVIARMMDIKGCLNKTDDGKFCVCCMAVFERNCRSCRGFGHDGCEGCAISGTVGCCCGAVE